MIVDHFFVQQLMKSEKVQQDLDSIDRLKVVSLDTNGNQSVKIPNFCFVMCSNIFNLSMQQFEASKSVIYRELDDIFPSRLQYVCQGINPRQWIQCTNPLLASLISDVLGDDDEWLHNSENIRQLRPWKSDESFINKFQTTKMLNKARFMQQLIESVTQTQVMNIPNVNFQNGDQNASPQFMTQKYVLIDDVNSFFTKFVEAS